MADDYEINPGASNPLMDLYRDAVTKLPSGRPHEPWGWTRDYPGTAQALGGMVDALGKGLSAIRAPANAAMVAPRGMRDMPEPNPAVMARMGRGLHGAPESDAGTVLSATQPVRYPRYEYQYPEQGQPGYPANQRGGPGDSGIVPRLDPWAPGVRSAADTPRSMRVGGDRPEPANDRNLSDSRPGQKPPSDVLEQMAKEIKAQSEAEFAKFTDPVGGRFDQAMRNGGKPPTVELNLPADKALVQRYLDALQKPKPGAATADKANLLTGLMDAVEAASKARTFRDFKVIDGGQPPGPFKPKD